MEKSGDGNPIFGVRVPKTLQDEIRIRAKEEELSVAAWLERHLRPILDAAPMPTLESRLMAVEMRLDALERRRGKNVAVQTEGHPRASKRPTRSGPNKTPSDIEAKILELRKAGWSERKIAKEVGMSPSGVHGILDRVQQG